MNPIKSLPTSSQVFERRQAQPLRFSLYGEFSDEERIRFFLPHRPLVRREL